jgi:hypothetical protein
MRYIIYICCISAVLVAGCTTPSDSITPDSIDRLVSRLSSDGRWHNGFTPVLPLPANATTKEIVSREFSGHTVSYKIMSVRQVHIQGSQPDLYTAVLIQTDVGDKIALCQYDGSMSGWWVRIFDTKTLKRTGIK